MRMIFRWFGENDDPISLSDIKQIPGVEGVAWTLHDKAAGEDWELKRIKKVVEQCDKQGLSAEVVESVNVHEDIKLGLESRDYYIEIYKETIKKLSSVGVKVICYNFMPVFDWIRTDLFHQSKDGSNAFFYEKEYVLKSPKEFSSLLIEKFGEFNMPGWEPERMAMLEAVFKKYSGITEDVLLRNLGYFLQKIIPTCEQAGVKMAIHPDDPPWSVFNLPRIVKNRADIKRILNLVNSPCNGIALCTGSLTPNINNDIPALIRKFSTRIHYMHIRNVKVFKNGDFKEVAHRASEGDVNIVEVLKTLKSVSFKGYCRPDHGRHIWGEEKHCRPGYGLYDRALGVMYLLGVWDTLSAK